MTIPGPQSKNSLEPGVRRSLRSLNAQAWGITVGITAGVLLFLLTNILVLRGGEVVGPHLGLLGIVLPGYSVTFVGSLIGFVYAFVIGYGVGRLVGWIYNTMASR